jgi:signal transduction histidine kinase
MMAGVEIQAHAIASLMEGDLPTTPPPLSQIIIVVMLSLFASLIYAYLRWQWMLVAAGMLLLVWLLFAFTWYGLRLEMLNLFHSILALTIPVLATIGVQITREVNLRRRTQFVLESVVQVSEQRMELEKILPVLAEDIQQVLKAKGVAVWLWDAKWQVVSERYSTGDNLNVTALARRMANNMQPIQESQQVVMPILWQGRLLGGFAAILRGRADQVSIDLLQNLSDEAAPSLENAILHRATERQYLLLDTILRESPAGIVILNRDLGIQQANKVASSWLSAGADASGRQTLVDQLQRLGVQTETVTEIRERLQKGQRFRTQITLEHTEAPLSSRPTNQPPTPKQVFNIDAAPLPGSGEWVLALNDISALAEVNELRTWMIRMTAHDLKNPLSQITGYIGLVMDYGSSELSADDRESLQRVMNAADQMSEIISEVTSLEQLQTGLKQREAVDLCAVAQDVIGQNDLDMTRRKQQFTAEISESVPVIQGSRIQLMQAMTNLLGNAIKYTPEAGRVTLRLFVKDTMIRFEVQDTGLGIPPDKQERLFQPFYRVRTEQTARINGTGLGLSLVKSVISAHGGRVGVISAEQQGSTFWFEIPIG